MSTPSFQVSFSISEANGQARHQIPQRVGLPIAQSTYFSDDPLSLNTESGESIYLEASPVSFWPDGSVRWLIIDFKISIASRSQTTLTLRAGESFPIKPHKIVITSGPDGSRVIDTGALQLQLDSNVFSLVRPTVGDVESNMIRSMIYLSDNSQNRFPAKVTDVSCSKIQSHLRSDVKVNGYFETAPTPLNFAATLSFYSESAVIDCSVSIHNPNRAEHIGGFWDMGDKGSVYFDELSFEFDFIPEEFRSLKLFNNVDYSSEALERNFSLYQDSSGGDHWNHTLHIDSQGNSSVAFKGFKLEVNGDEFSRGNRFSPVLTAESPNSCNTSIYPHKFWQNFPKAINRSENAISIGIFPSQKNKLHELQGGEKKTHKFSLSFDEFKHPILSHVQPVITTHPTQHYFESGALSNGLNPASESPIDHIIMKGIHGENSFFQKREIIDEYGWRNFGDLWADHETLEHGNAKDLVSHYNNQYDPIYGFFLQFIKTGNHSWFELMEDLALHVLDIDIYHTVEDRPEYNFGLFWHTDHYLDGSLCSHRSFSKSHMETNHVEQSGGGPGSEHCYTTGLMYYYFISGHEPAREAVLKLTDWSRVTVKGTRTVLETLLKIKKKNFRDLINIRKGKHVFSHRYPLTRGTGNFLNSLIDSYLLTSETAYLEEAGEIILNTISASDDIQYRELIDDIEKNWHYIIFLQYVGRYLEIAKNVSQLRSNYSASLSAFLHYCKWVLENETLYLDNKERLVYPNSTWVAQDIRKVSVLSIYSKYKHGPESSALARKKQQALTRQIVSYFDKSKDSDYTRILAILMQNYIYTLERENADSIEFDFLKEGRNVHIKSSKQTAAKAIRQGISDLYTALKNININSEIRWLKNRL